MCDNKSSITRSLCEQIFTSPIHWTKATDFPETATHTIDFGPGGLSGIGPLTAKNFEGRGVRVIVAGDKVPSPLVRSTSSSGSGGVRSGRPALFAPRKFDILAVFF